MKKSHYLFYCVLLWVNLFLISPVFAECVQSDPVVAITQFPYVDTNTTVTLTLTPFPAENSTIKMDVINPDDSTHTFIFNYNATAQSYYLSVRFTDPADFPFTIYGDGNCPTIEDNITGTFIVRNPYFVTFQGFSNASGGAYLNNFAVVSAEFTRGRQYNQDVEKYLTPLTFPVSAPAAFHAPYIDGQATLKLWEANTSYAVRLFDGVITYPSTYAAPNITKSYGTNIYLGTFGLNGTSTEYAFLITNQDIHPWRSVANILFFLSLFLIVIVAIFLFVRFPMMPYVYIGFASFFTFVIFVTRVGVWWFTGN